MLSALRCPERGQDKPAVRSKFDQNFKCHFHATGQPWLNSSLFTLCILVHCTYHVRVVEQLLRVVAQSPKMMHGETLRTLRR